MYQPARYHISVEEYEQAVEAGIFRPGARLELIEGEILEMAPMGSRHTLAAARLHELFLVGLYGLVKVFQQSPLRLRASEPEPDLYLVPPPFSRYEGRIPEAADALLVVEISDTTLAYHRGTKLRLYAEAGIPEVWILNLGSGQLEVYREPQGGGYRRLSTHSPGEPVAPLAYPDRPLEWW